MHTFEEMIEDIRRVRKFALDYECSSITNKANDAKTWYLARITHIALATPEKATCVKATPERLKIIQELVNDPNMLLIGHNLVYDLLVQYKAGYLDRKGLNCKILDTVGVSWLADENDDHGLKYLAKKYLNKTMVTYKEVTKTSPLAHRCNQINELIAHYKTLAEKCWNDKGGKRPYPEYTDAPMTKAAVRRALKAEGLKKAEIDRKVEELWSDEQREEYRKWVEHIIEEVTPQMTELEARMEEEFCAYACDDAATLFPLIDALIPELKARNALQHLRVEMVNRAESIRMTMTGMYIDEKGLIEFKEQTEKLVEQTLGRCFDLAKQEFNPGSSDDIRRVLFIEGGVKPPKFLSPRGIPRNVNKDFPKFTDSGNQFVIDWYYGRLTPEDSNGLLFEDFNINKIETYPELLLTKYLASDKNVLERIPNPIAQAILDYRSIVKIYTTYALGVMTRLPLWGTGRVHGIFNVWGAATGRYSSSDINMQNIPSRDKPDSYSELIRKVGPMIRTLFKAPPPDEEEPEGYMLIVADHSQIELRLATHVTQDKNLLKTYRDAVEYQGELYPMADIHSSTARLLPCKRSEAKAANFGLLYGMKPFTFAVQNRVIIPGTVEYDIKHTSKLSEGFFKAYSNLDVMYNYLLGRLGESRNFNTISGREYTISPELSYVSGGKILNSYNQGSGADLLKFCIYVYVTVVRPIMPELLLVGQVHDELIFQAPKRIAEKAAEIIKFIMEYPWYETAVPVFSSAKPCLSWGAKDSKKAGETGVLYTETEEGVMLFTRDNWEKYLALKERNAIIKEATCTILPKEKRQELERTLTLPKPPKVTKTLSEDFNEYLKTEKHTRHSLAE